MPPAARLRIRVSEPSAERAAELCRGLPPAIGGRSRRSPEATPPILDQGPSPVPLGHLSYSALDAFKRCGYRFYVERVLGVRGGAAVAASPESAPPAEDDDEPGGRRARRSGEREGDDPARTPTTAKALGNAVHAALEWSAPLGLGGARRRPACRAARPRGRGGRRARSGRARALVDGWLGSELARRARRDGAARGGAVRPPGRPARSCGGTWTCWESGAEDALVVDYKTDRVGSSSHRGAGRALRGAAGRLRAGRRRRRGADRADRPRLPRATGRAGGRGLRRGRASPPRASASRV